MTRNTSASPTLLPRRYSDTAKFAASISKDFKEYKEDVEKADDKRETMLDRAFGSMHSEVTLTNTRISVVAHSITEIRATAITRATWEKMEGRMVGNITAIGERIDDLMSKVAVSKVSDRTRP